MIVCVPGLRRLNFSGTNLTDDQLAKLSRLTALEELILGGRVTDAGLAHLKPLTRLNRLGLTHRITAPVPESWRASEILRSSRTSLCSCATPEPSPVGLMTSACFTPSAAETCCASI